MTSQLFGGLKNLVQVDLTGNVCINEDFVTADRVATLRLIVNEKCGFIENHQSALISQANIQKQNEANQKEKEKLQLELTAKTATINKHLIEIATLKARLEAESKVTAAAESKATLIMKMFDKLEAQYNATCAARTEDLQRTVKSKMTENNDLLEQQQVYKVEVKDMSSKINDCQIRLENCANNCKF